MVRKVSAAMAAVMIATSLFSGCGNNNKNADNGKTTLRWVLAGDKKNDTELVWEEFNKRLETKLPDTKVDFEMITFADYAEQWRLMAAANEKIDMAWHGWVLDFKDEVNKGAYMQIDDLLDEYAPKLKASIPEWVWKDQKIDGKLYSFPNYQKMVGTGSGLLMLEDKANKFLNKEALAKAFEESEAERYAKPYEFTQHWNDAVWDELDSYLGKLKSAGRLGLGFSPSILNWIEFNGVADGYGKAATVVKDSNGKYVAKSVYDDGGLGKKLFARMRDFYEKGYIRKDVLTATSNSTDEATEEGYAMWIMMTDDYTAQIESATKGVPIYVARTSLKAIPFGRVSDTNSVIPATSQNPERAMQLYEIVNSTEDTELFNLLTYGIEGKHYEKIDEKTIKKTDSENYEMQAWAIGDSFNAYETDKSVEGYNDYVLNILHDEKNHVQQPDPKLAEFVFDESKVKGNVAQVTSVLKEFDGLRYGVYADWEARYDAMIAKLEKSGVQKIIDEVQRQLDEKLNK